MRKLFIFLLIALSNQAFSQFPGSFYDFQDPHGSMIGSLPFFAKMDDWQSPSLAFFYPSMLKTYIHPLTAEVKFGIGMYQEFPDAKFEINAAPIEGGIMQGLIPALKVYGGNYGLDVQGASRAVFIHNDDVNNAGYGIYQIGGEKIQNYFSNKIGIGLESPEKMLDIAGDLRCTGPAEIGTGIALKSTNVTIPFPIYSNGTSVQFQFPFRIPMDQTGPPISQTFSLMSLTSNSDMNQVEITGTTKTLDLKVTNSTNTGSLDVVNTTNTGNLNVVNSTNTSTIDVARQTTTNTFKMINGAGNNKAMISDGSGQGQWTDINPWLNRYWEFTENQLDIFTHARNVGIGTSANEDVKYAGNRLSVYTNNVNTGLYLKNQAPLALDRYGISSNLTDPDGSSPDDGGGVSIDMPGGTTNGGAPASIGIYSKVDSKTSGIGLIGISSQVSDNATSTVPIYGIKSLINGSDNSNQRYGLYSEIAGGTPNNRWAGYFKGGDVEINYGSLIIGLPGYKRFCIQTQHWNMGNNHSLNIFPSDGTGTWTTEFTKKGITLYDDGTLTVNGKIYAREIEVTLDDYPIPDYVFAPGYKILPLNELEAYVKTNQHLPEIPSASDIKANGANLGEMNVALLKKVEELTLYIIEMKKEIEKIKSK